MIEDMWYPIVASHQLTRRRPESLRRLGRDLVAWRDRFGRPVIQDARCPHKGANLGIGRMNDGQLECRYHGFRFDEQGTCVAAPCLGASGHIPKGMQITTYECREEHGLVWMWYGEPRETYPEIICPPEVADTTLLHATTSWERPVHYTRYIESLLEFYHVTYVHRDHWFNRIDYLFLYGTPSRLGLDGKRRYLEATTIMNQHTETDGLTIRTEFDHGNENEPSNSTHYKITFSFPCMVHVVTEQFQATAWLVPMDEERTTIILRWYEYEGLKDSLRLKPIRQFLPWVSLYMEKWVQDPQDVVVIASQTPRISGRGVNKFVAADEVNSRYLAMRERLLRAAEERKQATATQASQPSGTAAQADALQAQGADTAPAPMPEPAQETRETQETGDWVDEKVLS